MPRKRVDTRLISAHDVLACRDRNPALFSLQFDPAIMRDFVPSLENADPAASERWQNHCAGRL